MPKSWLILLVAFGLLRLIFWLTTFPNPDEAYYWLWGQHPALSYYDHPPLNAWIQGVFTAAFGRSTLTLRLPNLLSSCTLFYTYYRIVHYLYREHVQRYFLLTVMLVLASPLYFLFLALAWHDHWLITFSLAAAYLFITFLDQYVIDRAGESWRLYAAAGAIGFAALCKYNAVFVLFGFLAALLADQRLRPLLRDRRLYFAGAIVVGLLAPILVWNVSNQFQSLQYYVNRSVQPRDTSLKIGSCFTFLVVSFFVVSPFYWRGFYHSLKQPSSLMRKDSVYATIAFWVLIVSTIFLTILSLISAALYYWNITAYLLLFPLLPAYFSRSTQNSGKVGTRTAFWGAQLYGLFFAALLVVHYSVLPLSTLISKEADPDSRMLFGWSEIAAIVKKQAAELGATSLLMTTDYRSASALAYQLNEKNVIAISDRIDQFDFWYRDLQAFKGSNAVVLSDDWFSAPPELLAQFDRVSEPVTIPISRLGVHIKNYYVHRGYRFKGSN